MVLAVPVATAETSRSGRGALWFTDGGTSIGRITTAGKVTTFTGTGIDEPSGIAVGPDGALWFTNPAASASAMRADRKGSMVSPSR